MSSNNTVSNVFSGLKSQTLITVIMGVLEIISFSILSRLLNQEDFGYYAVITAVTGVLQTITEAGMGSSVIQKKDPSNDFISTAFTLSFAIGVFFAVFLIIAAPFFSNLMVKSDSLTLAFRLMAIPLLLSNVNSIARALMMRKLDFFKFGILSIISFIISYSIGIYLASNGFGFYSILVIVITGQILSTVLLYSFSKFKPEFKIEKSEAKGIFVFGGWLTGSAIVRSITEQMDKFILSRWISVKALGAFDRPSGFIQKTTGQINGIFDTVLYPIISRIQNEKDKISSSFSICVVLISLMSCVLSSLFFLGSKTIIWIFFGEQWMHLSVIFQILSVSVIAICFCRVADVFFRATGSVKRYFWNRVITCVFTVLCLFIGCQFGILGAAIALAISKFIDLIVKVLMLKDIILIDKKELLGSIFSTCRWPVLFVLISLPFLLLEYGSLVALALYSVLLLVLCVKYPHKMGKPFNTYIYPQISPIINKIFRK